ncbi:hypothetical protein CHELA1G11_50044 [Hyphomicrobiales bacterium]|nr:hypothetical protein CHELA1G11_50044 [Hyphomicrobiales bacterium]
MDPPPWSRAPARRDPRLLCGSQRAWSPRERGRRRSARSSDAPEHLQNCGQRRSVDARRHTNDGALHDNLDHRLTAGGPSGLRRVRGDNNRGKGQRMIARLALGLTTPGEQVLGRHAVTARHFGHHRAGRHRLFQDPRLLIRRPASAPAGSGDHFQAPHRPRRLKHRVKHRHKTIPNQRSSVSPLRHANVRWGPDIAYGNCKTHRTLTVLMSATLPQMPNSRQPDSPSWTQRFHPKQDKFDWFESVATLTTYLEAVMDCDVVYGLSQHEADQCNDMQICEGSR